MTVTGRKHLRPREVKGSPQGYTVVRNGLGTQVQGTEDSGTFVRWLRWGPDRIIKGSLGEVWASRSHVPDTLGKGAPHFIRPVPNFGVPHLQTPAR